jgi:hypothetical protein
MEYKNEKDIRERMGVEEVLLILSQTMQDVKDRKITLKYALVVSRLALALTKTIETVELRDRIALIEQILEKRK